MAILPFVPLDYEKIENTSLDTTDVRLMNWKEIPFTHSSDPIDSSVSSPVSPARAIIAPIHLSSGSSARSR